MPPCGGWQAARRRGSRTAARAADRRACRGRQRARSAHRASVGRTTISGRCRSSAIWSYPRRGNEQLLHGAPVRGEVVESGHEPDRVSGTDSLRCMSEPTPPSSSRRPRARRSSRPSCRSSGRSTASSACRSSARSRTRSLRNLDVDDRHKQPFGPRARRRVRARRGSRPPRSVLRSPRSPPAGPPSASPTTRRSCARSSAMAGSPRRRAASQRPHSTQLWDVDHVGPDGRSARPRA